MKNAAPNFFIIGAPKCGTTALSEYLKDHPNIFISTPKEPKYFDFDLRHRMEIGLEEYLSLFDKADPAVKKAIGEGSVSYIYSKRAVEEIKKFNPEAKFIVMLRNPADLIPAWHSQQVFDGQENILDFETAWKTEDERKRGLKLPPFCIEIDNIFYSGWGKLGEQVERLLASIAREKIKFIFFEDFVNDTKKVYEDILSFLGVPSDGRTQFKKINEKKEVKSVFLHQLLTGIFVRLIKLSNKLGLKKRLGLATNILLLNSKPSSRTLISNRFRNELIDYYREDVLKLSRLLDRDLAEWLVKPKVASVKKVLIYRIGHLGDTLIALPAIWALKNNFPDAKFHLLSEKTQYGSKVWGKEIFADSGFFEGYFHYSLGPKLLGKFLQPFRYLKLLMELKRENFDALAYLTPSKRSQWQVKRDLQFFKTVGIKNIFGMEGFDDQTLINVKTEKEADLLVNRLKLSGLQVPDFGKGRVDIELAPEEEEEFKKIVSSLPTSNGRPWIGVGLGSKQPVKIWPYDRYLSVIKVLVEKYGVWPVVLGGTEDKDLGNRLIAEIGCGYNFAGSFPVRLSLAALKSCEFYLGNDTGTMHLAVAAGLPCVAIFSSHAPEGQWYPYGTKHKIYRKQIACESCGLEVCVEKKMECILSINPEEVLEGCLEIMGTLKKNQDQYVVKV